MSRHTLNSHPFSLRHTEPHLFTTALQSGLGPVQMNPGNKLLGFKSVWCEPGLTGHRICLGRPVVITCPLFLFQYSAPMKDESPLPPEDIRSFALQAIYGSDFQDCGTEFKKDLK